MTRIPCFTMMVLGAALASGLVAACDDAADQEREVVCPSESGPFRLEDSRITGTLEFEPPAEPLGRGDTLLVTGTAFHEDGLAIREVRVAGATATRDEFNFGRWSATISYEAVVTASPTSAESQVEIQAVAIDACGKRYPFGVATVEVDPSPHVDVDELSITVEYPEGIDFIPASGAVPAIVTIVGTGRAAGAVVAVTSDVGELRGLDEGGNVVLGAPAGETDVGTATLVFSADDPGTATVAATVEDKLAVALVRIEGPPTLSPRRATLVPGASIEVDVAGATDVRCTATPDDDLVVAHFDAPLSGDPMPLEVDEGGRRVLVVSAAAEPVQLETEVVVACTDDFGQVGGGRYRLGEGAFTEPADPGSEEPIDPGGSSEEPPPEEEPLPEDP